jgi:hypothetical protein
MGRRRANKKLSKQARSGVRPGTCEQKKWTPGQLALRPWVCYFDAIISRPKIVVNGYPSDIFYSSTPCISSNGLLSTIFSKFSRVTPI